MINVMISISLLSNNIPASPAYGVFTSQLIRYARASSLYKDFIDRSMLLARKLLTQGYEMPRLVSSLRKFYGRHHELIDRYDVHVSRMSRNFKIIFVVSYLI